MSILVCHQSTLGSLSQSTGRSMVPVCMFYSFIPFPLCQQVCALRCFSARYAEGECAFKQFLWLFIMSQLILANTTKP